MTDNQTPTEDTDLTAAELAEEQSVAIDALTGEVVDADDDDEGEDIPDGISPELFHDPYGEEPLSTSKEEFEALLAEFSEDFQDIREGEIVQARAPSPWTNSRIRPMRAKRSKSSWRASRTTTAWWSSPRRRRTS
jgi:hypothetical protein